MGRIEPRTFQAGNGRELTIRCVEPDEAVSLLAFADHSDRTSEYMISQPGERSMTEEQEREWLRKNLDEPGSLAIAAYDAGGIVGFVSFKGNERRRIAHHGHFGITVHKDWRGQGVGTQLIRALLDWAAASPTIEKVCLGVFETNTRARALYAKLGFREECRRTREFKLGPGKYVDDIQMSIWVKPG